MLRATPGRVPMARSDRMPARADGVRRPDAPVHRPSLGLLYSEPFRAAAEFARNRLGSLLDTAPGDGHPVVIFPGLGGGAKSVASLCAYCRSLGYDAFDWGRGLSTGPKGDLDAWLQALRSELEQRLGPNAQPATLIGWSLGGLYAREIGKLMAPRVRQVITLGTPFNTEADHTRVGWLFRLLGGGSADLDPALSRRLRAPPPMRTTSIYSRSDGVVAWQTCRHPRRSSLVHDVEVDGSHLGIGWNRDVQAVIADRLAKRPGPCGQYQRAH